MKQYFILLIACAATALATILIKNYCEEPVEFIQGGDIQKAQTIDSLQHLADSTYALLYPCEIELNRFQIALEILRRRNPEAAEQYSTIISEETE